MQLVKTSLLPHLLLAIFVVIGLILPPLPAFAAQATGHAGQMAAMADDMPNCPGPMTPDDCQKCPLMVVCAVEGVTFRCGTLPGAPMACNEIRALLPGNDALLAGLGSSPPARPPRTPVIPA